MAVKQSKSFWRKVHERYRYSLILLRQLVITDFKLRYEGSVLGYVWSVLKPLALFAILYLVFGVFLATSRGIPHYPVYLLLGIIAWNFFSEVTNSSVKAIVSRDSLIRKINFPKYVIVFSTSISALINVAINLVIVGILMAITHVPFALKDFLLVLPMLELFILAVGVGFVLSTLYVRYRDVSYIWELFMQAAFYATPIIYPLTRVPHKAAKILILSPAAQSIQDLRHLLVTSKTDTISMVYGSGWYRLVPLAICIAVFVAGAALFRWRSPGFAEEV